MSEQLSRWRTSSYSVNDGACVEVATFVRIEGYLILELAVRIRDSKDKGLTALEVNPKAWRSFIAAIAASVSVS